MNIKDYAKINKIMNREYIPYGVNDKEYFDCFSAITEGEILRDNLKFNEQFDTFINKIKNIYNDLYINGINCNQLVVSCDISLYVSKECFNEHGQLKQNIETYKDYVECYCDVYYKDEDRLELVDDFEVCFLGVSFNLLMKKLKECGILILGITNYNELKRKTFSQNSKGITNSIQITKDKVKKYYKERK